MHDAVPDGVDGGDVCAGPPPTPRRSHRALAWVGQRPRAAASSAPRTLSFRLLDPAFTTRTRTSPPCQGGTHHARFGRPAVSTSTGSVAPATGRGAREHSTPTGGRPTIWRSARSTCSTTRCCASRCVSSTSSPACSATGERAPGSTSSTPTSTASSTSAAPIVLYVCGPGHGGPAMVANAWLEGTYSELYSHVSRDAKGMARLFRQFSFPGGIPSHAAPDTPGSINEGGELGYGLAHAYGAAFDNPDLVVACVVGDGEAETGALATSWHANKFLDPVGDGAVLPILHLNGYKIANPTVLARIPDVELSALFTGYGYRPLLVRGRVRRRGPHARAPEDGGGTRDAAFDEIASDLGRGPLRGGPGAAGLAHDHPAHPQGLDGPEIRGRRSPSKGRGGRIRSRSARSGPTLRTWRSSRNGCAATGPRSSSTRSGRPVPEIAALAPRRRPPHECHAARQRRGAAAGPRAPRLDAPTRWRCSHRAPRCTRRRRCSGGSSAT